MILNLEDKVGAMDIGMERSERRLLAAIAKSRCNRGWVECPSNRCKWETREEMIEIDQLLLRKTRLILISITFCFESSKVIILITS